jgi:hypothetical protein
MKVPGDAQVGCETRANKVAAGYLPPRRGFENDGNGSSIMWPEGRAHTEG